MKNLVKIFLSKSVLSKFIFLTIILAIGLTAGYFLGQKDKLPAKVEAPKDRYVAFLLEINDKIQTNYWDKISQEDLNVLYTKGTEKLTGQLVNSPPKTKEDLEKFLTQTLKNLSEEQKKKEFSVSLADIVLANLQPFGRSRLYSKKDEIALKNTVENKNPQINQYQVLGVEKDASSDQIKQAFESKARELQKESSPEAQQKLAAITQAYNTLKDTESRKIYDESGVEPTMSYKLLRPEIFYIHINKFSPTTIEELVRATQKVDQGLILDTLILDLRDNIGGAIDGLPYFLGPFIGNDQYAYQFLHQGEKIDFKTKIGWLPSLVRYKKVVVLINEKSQSSAEVMAATLKKYNVGVILGTPTKGWGTVERVFDIEQQIDPTEKYSMFLVHSLTLREDGQPIEGKGVEPHINITDPNWEQELYSRFHYSELIQAIKEII